MKMFTQLRFTYEQEHNPEEFFIPYVWPLVRSSSGIDFNPSAVHLISVESPPEVQFTRNSLNFSQMPQCIPSLDKLRNLMDKLRIVDLRLLTYKKKLAFWINTYNACIMHAFLHYGLPSTMDKLLALMNKIRVYTAENVMNELDNAKTEYLHASIEVTIKKRVVLPKLLYCTGICKILQTIWNRCWSGSTILQSICQGPHR